MRRVALLLAVLPAAALAGCRRSDDGRVRLSGRLEATQVDLAPRVAGRVLAVHAQEGDRVKAGALLVSLDLGEAAFAVPRDRAGLEAAEARHRDLKAGSRPAEIDAARADVADRRAANDLAKKELERQAALLARSVASVRDVDRARTETERTLAALRAAEERLRLSRQGSRREQVDQAGREADRARGVLKQSETVAKESEIRAPADGVVLHRFAEPGLLLGAGQPALTLAFTDRLYVRTFIPETKLGLVKPGQKATVTVDAHPGKGFAGRVTEISSEAEFTPKPVETARERVNLVYAAKVDLEAGWNAPLVPGQPADVVVEAAAGPAAVGSREP